VKEREERFENYLKTNKYAIGREMKGCKGGRLVKLRNRGRGTWDLHGWLSREAKKNEEAGEIKVRA